MQTNQISSKEKNQSKRLVDNSDKKNTIDNKLPNEEKKKDPKTTEKRYWEPLIPRSGSKDRIEIW